MQRLWSAPVLAGVAATTGILTDGKFTLSIGAGSIYNPGWRAANNLPDWPAIAMMRDYLVTLRRLLAGETVDHQGKAVKIRGARLPVTPPRVPVFMHEYIRVCVDDDEDVARHGIDSVRAVMQACAPALAHA